MPLLPLRYDFSNPAAVTAWATGIAAAVRAGNHSGVFIDGYLGWKDCLPPKPHAADASGDRASAGASSVGSSGTTGLGHLPGCSEAGSGLRTTVGNRTINATALLQGWWYETGPALAKALPPGSILIPNCEGGYACQDGNGSSRIPGYTGVMEEFFGELDNLPNQVIVSITVAFVDQRWWCSVQYAASLQGGCQSVGMSNRQPA
jgi:hypothetical protein